MISICRSNQIDESYYQDYSFRVVNKGIRVRNPWLHRAYFEGKDKLRETVRSWTPLRWALRQMKGSVERAYQKLNVAETRETLMSAATEKYLRDYYSGEAAYLRSLLGRDIPWSGSHSSGRT